MVGQGDGDGDDASRFLSARGDDNSRVQLPWINTTIKDANMAALNMAGRAHASNFQTPRRQYFLRLNSLSRAAQFRV